METGVRMHVILLVITALLPLLLTQETEPYLKISPPLKDLASPTGKPYGLMCEGVSEDERDFTEMKWTNPRGEVVLDGTPGVKQYSPNQLKLSFISPTTDDSGHYNCTALYANARILHAGAHVTFYEDIRFENCPEQQDLVVGQPGEIMCHPTASPSPKVRWEKDKQSIRTERYTVTQDGITISTVSEEDKGQYTVEAFVALTGNNKYRFITVDVLTPPKISVPSETYEVVQGEEYNILCQAEGSPPLLYKWLDPRLRDLSKEEGYRVEDGKLTIFKVERNMGGDYKCVVKNGAAEVEAVFKLEVLVRPNILEFVNITRRTGEEATIVCRAEGEPRPVLSIRREGDSLDIQTGQDDRIEVDQVAEGEHQLLTLRIRNVRRSDDGLYYCRASNDAGSAERVGHLEVQFPPNMSLTPTTNVKAWSAKPANLSCVAEANPNASLSWRFQNDLIEPDDRRFKIVGGRSRSNLLVSTDDRTNNYEVFGTYTCEARNALGDDKINIVLEEATVPGQLSQVMFDKVTSTTITFKLLGPSNDGGLPILGYLVKYRREAQNDEPEFSEDWPRESAHILSNLKPRAQYRFSFAARNAVGEGPWKKETYIMPEETVPEPPLFVTAEETRSDFPDRFQVRFVIPDDNGEPIQYFELRYFKVEREIHGWRQVEKAAERKISFSEASQNPAVDLMGLSPDTYYKVELRAYNKIGNSIPGTLVFHTKKGETSDGHVLLNEELLSVPIIVAIVVVALLVLLIILDITCFFRFHCGLLHLLRYRTCGASPDKIQSAMEDGRAWNKETRPIDLIVDENFKNKSPKGSKTSIGKSSPV